MVTSDGICITVQKPSDDMYFAPLYHTLKGVRSH